MLETQQPLRAHIFSETGPAEPPPQTGGMHREPRSQPQNDPPPPHPAHQESIYRLSPPSSETFELAEDGREQSMPVQNTVPEAVPAASDAPAVQVENLVVVGSFRDLYIFCRNGDNLIVIDQHAAHERLLYEDLRKQYLQGRIATQNLLFPVTLELTVYQSQLVEANVEALEAMGFSVRDFGATTWVLSSVPALAGSSSPQELFLEILERFGSERGAPGTDRLEHILSTMACKAAVKSGDMLSGDEIKALLERMVKADLFSHCPHGRPVVKVFNPVEIKKWFHRT
jgi:DNA mismatch repair protein MutL